MKSNNNLSQLTLEELQAKYTKTKGAVIGLSIVMIIAFIILTYVAINNQNYALIVVGIGSLFAFLPIWIQLNQMKKEIESRTK